MKVSGDMLEVLAEKLVLSGQNLISMIAELKRNSVVSDFTALNQNIDRQDAVYHKESAELQSQLATLQQHLRQVGTACMCKCDV